MARRKARKSRPKKQPISILNVAESALIANALTEGLFHADLKTWVIGSRNSAGNPSWGTDGSSVMTLPELLGMDREGSRVAFGGNYGAGRTFQSQIVANAKANAPQMITSLVMIPIAFKLAKKAARRPLNQANRLLKTSSIGVKL